MHRILIIINKNTNEIPGELSRENTIPSHVKITCTCEKITVTMTT